MCDVSDGLSTDLGQLLPETAGAIVETERLPISEALKSIILRKHSSMLCRVERNTNFYLLPRYSGCFQDL